MVLSLHSVRNSAAITTYMILHLIYSKICLLPHPFSKVYEYVLGCLKAFYWMWFKRYRYISTYTCFSNGMIFFFLFYSIKREIELMTMIASLTMADAWIYASCALCPIPSFSVIQCCIRERIRLIENPEAFYNILYMYETWAFLRIFFFCSWDSY